MSVVIGQSRPRSPAADCTDQERDYKKQRSSEGGMVASQPHGLDSSDCEQYVDTQYRHKYVQKGHYIQLLHSALTDLGFEQAAKALQSESACVCEHPSIARMRQHVQKYEWQQACACIQKCSDLTAEQQRQACFCLLREHVLEVRRRPHDHDVQHARAQSHTIETAMTSNHTSPCPALPTHAWIALLPVLQHDLRESVIDTL